MAPSINPHWIIFTSLAVSTYAVVALTQHMLKTFRDAAEITDTSPQSKYIDQKTEDKIKVATLEKLMSSHNPEIAQTARAIIVDRALHDKQTFKELLKSVIDRNSERRERALRALHLLGSHCEFMHLWGPDTFAPKARRVLGREGEQCRS
jgi:biopolymer transport protein ExbB/TolQ